MNKFEVVSAYADKAINIPTRATHAAAGYDFEVAEDIIIPSMEKMWYKALGSTWEDHPRTLSEIAKFTKEEKVKPTLVPTGIKCQLASDCYLELSVRSSTPLKHWLILANGVGIIDGDYYNNSDNEGHIYFQLINLSPFDIQLRKGDKIGQGIIKKYEVTDDDYKYEKKERAGGFGSTSATADYVERFANRCEHLANRCKPDNNCYDEISLTSISEDTNRYDSLINNLETDEKINGINIIAEKIQEIQDSLYKKLQLQYE